MTSLIQEQWLRAWLTGSYVTQIRLKADLSVSHPDLREVISVRDEVLHRSIASELLRLDRDLEGRVASITVQRGDTCPAAAAAVAAAQRAVEQAETLLDGTRRAYHLALGEGDEADAALARADQQAARAELVAAKAALAAAVKAVSETDPASTETKETALADLGSLALIAVLLERVGARAPAALNDTLARFLSDLRVHPDAPGGTPGGSTPRGGTTPGGGTSPGVGRPRLPLPSSTVVVKAVKSGSRLVVDVSPDQAGRQCKLHVQKQAGKTSRKWMALRQHYLTSGRKGTKTLDLPKGTYRIFVDSRPGYVATLSKPITLTKLHTEARGRACR